MITISISNADAADLFVSLTDENVAPSAIVLNQQRINTKMTVTVNVQEDGNGNGNVSWTAVRTNDPSVSGQGTAHPANSDTVIVKTAGEAGHFKSPEAR